MSALEKLSQHFADTAAAKAAEEVPAEKAAQIRHAETDPVSFVTWYKHNGSEYFEDGDVKKMLSDLATGYERMAQIYGEKKHDSEWQQQQHRNSVSGYHTANTALKELGKPVETVVENVLDQINEATGANLTGGNS